MRATTTGPTLTCRAIAGSYVVILAWDFVEGHDGRLDELQGFAIERTELDGSGRAVERYWIRGIKRYRFKDRGLAPGTPVSTAEHPIQSFQWGDYTALAGRRYEYRIVAVHGQPKLLVLDDANAVTVAVETEREFLLEGGGAPDRASHDVYFNRGVIGSQAFARQFPGVQPTEHLPPDDPAMVWLSRGLFEALERFIGLAADERFGLRAAFYEFHYEPVGFAFKRAVERDADVSIVYDAATKYREGSEDMIAAAGLDAPNVVIPRRNTKKLPHNKFIVLLRDGEPVAVWLGSTNISASGIFGQSNVGHVVWSGPIARQYLEYWERLAADTPPDELREANAAATPLPDGLPPEGVIALFSPRDGSSSTATLDWYAFLMASAKRIVCFTVAFNLDKVFQEVLAQDNDVLRYIVKQADLSETERIGRDRDVLFAAGGRLGAGSLANFLEESGNPLSGRDYIHDKFMLVDPLGDDPIVVTGSANFSHPSQRGNDENMIVVRGDTRVSDIYFGEFMRIFDHHYARYLVKKLADSERHDPNAGYLKEKPVDWIRGHFDPHGHKAKRRTYFVG